MVTLITDYLTKESFFFECCEQIFHSHLFFKEVVASEDFSVFQPFKNLMFCCSYFCMLINHNNLWGHRGHDRMVDGFTTTHAISAYHH